MDGIDRLCRRLERRHRIERALAGVLPLAALSGLAGATALAVVRLAVPEAGWFAPTLAATAALIPLARLPRAWAVRTPRWRLAGEADSLAQADGVLMALAAQPDPAWTQRIAPRLAGVRPPPLRATGLNAALAAGALLVGAWFLPQVEAVPPAPPVAAGAMRGAEAALEHLRDLALAAPEEIKTLEQRLDAVRAALAGKGLNQQTWAALDALERDLDATQAQAADRLADALAKADALAGLSANGDVDAAAAAAADLTAALAELEAQAPGLAAKLPAGAEGQALLRLAQQAMAGGALTEAQRQALQRWGLDPAKAGPGQPGDPAAAQALAARLAGELAQAAGMAGMGDEGKGQPGGRPGPGGGHPDLDWRTVQRVESGFRDRLAAGDPRNPETGAPIGTQSRAPRPDEQTATATTTVGAPLVGQDATAAGTRATAVAPRHRAAVAGYFAAAPPP